VAKSSETTESMQGKLIKKIHENGGKACDNVVGYLRKSEVKVNSHHSILPSTSSTRRRVRTFQEALNTTKNFT